MNIIINEYGNEQACSNCGDEWSALTMESGVLLCEDCYSEWVASEGDE
jgi:uncharacterized Zn ribbon protein